MDIIREYVHSESVCLETGTIRSYDEKHESTRIIGECCKSLLSIDNEIKSIKISKDICSNLSTVTWVHGDSLECMSELRGREYDFILLDSVNDPEHIYEEYLLALKLIKIGGVIMIDDYIPSRPQPEGKKGLKIHELFTSKNMLHRLKVGVTWKGAQCIIENVDEEILNMV